MLLVGALVLGDPAGVGTPLERVPHAAKCGWGSAWSCSSRTTGVSSPTPAASPAVPCPWLLAPLGPGAEDQTGPAPHRQQLQGNGSRPGGGDGDQGLGGSGPALPGKEAS